MLLCTGNSKAGAALPGLACGWWLGLVIGAACPVFLESFNLVDILQTFQTSNFQFFQGLLPSSVQP